VAIVSDDRSGPAATEEQGTSTLQRAVGKAALAQMRPMERESWEAYLREAIQLPYIDWNVNQDLAPLSKKPLRTARRRAQALNRLYRTDQACPPHSVWFTKNHRLYLPLVIAMARIEGIERQLGYNGGDKDDGSNLADLRTIKKIIASASNVHRRHQMLSKAYQKSVNSKIQFLVNHQKKLREKRKISTAPKVEM
jgi:hypothetical protein